MLTTILLICTIVVGLFLALVHPFLGIIDCLAAKQRTGSSKALWVIGTLFFGPLASIPYGLLGGASAWFRSTSRVALQVAAVGVVLTIVATMRNRESTSQVNLSFLEDQQVAVAADDQAEASSQGPATTDVPDTQLRGNDADVAEMTDAMPTVFVQTEATGLELEPNQDDADTPVEWAKVVDDMPTIDLGNGSPETAPQAGDEELATNEQVLAGTTQNSIPFLSQWLGDAARKIATIIPETENAAAFEVASDEAGAELQVQQETKMPETKMVAKKQLETDAKIVTSTAKDFRSPANVEHIEVDGEDSSTPKKAVFNRYTNSTQRLNFAPPAAKKPVNRYLAQ